MSDFMLVKVWCLLSVATSLVVATPVRADRTRHFVFRYDAVVKDLPAGAKVVDIWLPIPPDTLSQDVKSMDIRSAVKGEIGRDPAYGNQIWHARFEVDDHQPLRVAQRVDIVRRERRDVDTNPPAKSQVERHLKLFEKPNRLVPINSRFTKMAADQTRDKRDPMTMAKALYDYVLGWMSYDKSGHGWGRGDANYACDVRRGNCTDFHSFFIALSRSADIPARFWIGFGIPARRGKGVVTGYHCWAEFWVQKRGWIPVDISEADKDPTKSQYFFGRLDENRIVYTVGRDLTLVPPQAGPPVNFFVYPYVEVDGRPWDHVERSFSYEDAP